MTTNLLQAVVSVFLATNVVTQYETRSVPVPCPDGRIGCAVYHSKTEPVENPSWRTVDTRIVRVKRTEIPSIGYSKDEETLVTNNIVFERREYTWKVDTNMSRSLQKGGVLLMGGVVTNMTSKLQSGGVVYTIWPDYQQYATNLILTNSIKMSISSNILFITPSITNSPSK